MLTNKINIVAIARDKVVAAEVSPSKGKVKFVKEYGWQKETLGVVFLEIIKHFGTKDFRLLVSDNLCYLVKFAIPADTRKDEERDIVRSKLKEKVPEDFDDDEWDYKEIGEGERENSETINVLVCALVKDFFKTLKSAVRESGIVFEAVECETVAVSRDVNPLIGLALKEDLTGKDEKVLNITSLNVLRDMSVDHDAVGQENGAKKSKTILILLAVLSILVLLAVVGARLLNWEIKLIMNNDIRGVDEETSERVENGLFETEPAEEGVFYDFSSVKVLVQNGTGVEGEAEKIGELLKTEGFGEIVAEDADDFDYNASVVIVKENVPEQAFFRIEDLMEEDYTIAKANEYLDESYFYDIVIIVGRKR
jgi:hypothetical protein